ncbi:MAG: indole-3-glycerol phosphate synthase [Proteobacteria bacterium]|nr:MAG: indole-3-glycerol phosphate synthase [Pseudomonadota bacterium]
MSPPPNILTEILAGTRARLEASPVDLDALEVKARARAAGPDALAALRAPGARIIAEVKRRSPSAGTIRDVADPVTVAARYAARGAAAISVLTEPDHFGGSLADLARVADAVSVPCLRKDFVVGRRQLLEARAAGASLVLLIVAALTDAELRDLREDIEALGMHALVEAHDAEQTRRAVASGARIIGINNRDLRTFEVDLSTCERLRPLIGDSAVPVAESGIATRADVRRLQAGGFDAFLVGGSLMGAEDPGAALAALLGEGAA